VESLGKCGRLRLRRTRQAYVSATRCGVTSCFFKLVSSISKIEQNGSLTGEIIFLDAPMPVILPQRVARPHERMTLGKGTLTGDKPKRSPKVDDTTTRDGFLQRGKQNL
jgi:hypothetical protein